jgi:hypothetical protein
MWRVIINASDENGKKIYDLRAEGVLVLPRPMTALHAADYALRVAVRQEPVPAEFEVAIWGWDDLASDITRLSGAVARYDDERGVYLRHAPWLIGVQDREIGEPEGAAFFPLDQGNA